MTSQEALEVIEETLMHLHDVVDRLEHKLATERAHSKGLRAAMREFCDHVEAGEVLSVKTYAKFISLLGDAR